MTHTFPSGIQKFSNSEDVRVRKDECLENTSPKGFSASKCNVGNWIVSKSLEYFKKLFGIVLDFFGNFWNFFGNFWNFFGTFLRIFLVGSFGRIIGRIFWKEFFGRNSLFTVELICLSRFGFCQGFV